MNRILKKPYIEMPDFDDMTDEEIAKTRWYYHKARNDSVIVDLFQGQFKSRLICNVCHKVMKLKKVNPAPHADTMTIP
jgi:ubiquitin C-terminal hydrolase